MNKLSAHAARAAAAAAISAWLAACGSGGERAVEPPPPGREQALAVSQPGELVRLVQGKLRERQARSFDFTADSVVGIPVPAVQATAGAAARSGPLAQEQGVDEADLLQTDGDHLYSLQPASAGQRLQVHARGANGHASALATLELLPGAMAEGTGQGLHLSADGRTLAVIGQSWAQPAWACPGICNFLPQSSSVELQRVDVGTPAAPAAGERLSIEGNLVDSRRIGDTLYVVTSHRPWLRAETLASASAAEREAAINALAATDLLPRLRRNGGAPTPLLSETDCYVQAANASLAIEVTTITRFDLRSPTLAHSSRCFVGGTEALYMTAGNLYLATTRYSYNLPMATTTLFAYPAEITTDLHKFALTAGGLQYRGSGQVNGHLGWDTERKSYRLSEHNGDLRVLSFTGTLGWIGAPGIGDTGNAGTPASPALLTVLRERASDQTLQPLSTLPNAARPAALGKPGEQVYGVRFVGDRAYVVTFRRMDPLYVIDLADPAAPRIAGELDLAGFSESLFPLADGLLLGVGRDADGDGRVTGLKVALFDVADAARPRLLASSSFGGAFSSMAQDYSRHGLNLLVKDGVARIAMPVSLAPAGAYRNDGWRHGLWRCEIDTRTRTMVERNLLGGTDGDPGYWVAYDRSLQIGEQVHYLGGGGLSSFDW